MTKKKTMPFDGQFEESEHLEQFVGDAEEDKGSETHNNIDLNCYSFIHSKDKERFSPDGLTDDELISLFRQTGIDVLTVDLEFVPGTPYKWIAEYSTQAHFLYEWSDTTPLRAIAGFVILYYLAEREWNEYYIRELAGRKEQRYD